MNVGVSIDPFELAVQRLAGKTPVASALRTAEWREVAIGLRERAQFSAGVTSMDVMRSIQGLLEEWVTLGRDNPGQAFMDQSKFVADMRAVLGAAPGDSKDLTDITSRRRLEMIYDIQTRDAMEFGRWKAGQDPVLLDMWPAQEFLRIEDRIKPRLNWAERWVAAGGRMFQGRMIARKDDPVWESLSVFGRPWPPFDYQSGMGVVDVPRAEAEALGVIGPEDKVAETEGAFNDKVEASVSRDNNGKAAEQVLQDAFGDQIVLVGEKMRWHPHVVDDFVNGVFSGASKSGVLLGTASQQAVSMSPFDISGAKFWMRSDGVRHAFKHHGPKNVFGAGTGEPRGNQRALDKLDFRNVPYVLREPDYIEAGKLANTGIFWKVINGEWVAVMVNKTSVGSQKRYYTMDTMWIMKSGVVPHTVPMPLPQSQTSKTP
jgi:hypothetical protein